MSKLRLELTKTELDWIELALIEKIEQLKKSKINIQKSNTDCKKLLTEITNVYIENINNIIEKIKNKKNNLIKENK
jgi:pyruvate kinase